MQNIIQKPNNSLYFLLFQDVKIVRGKGSSMIYDLSRNDLFPIENNYLDLLESCLGKTKEEVLGIGPEKVLDFLNYFIKKDLAFFTDSPKSFPDISMSFHFPSEIISSVIELGNLNEDLIMNVVSQIDSLGCKLLLLVVNNQLYDFIIFEKILDKLKDSFIVNIELVLPYSFKSLIDDTFLGVHLRISKIIFLGADKNELYHSESKAQIILSTQYKFDPSEIINPDFFAINITLFSEAINYNLGLNRKVCVDKDGFILNYLGHSQKFGNVKKDLISDVIKRSELKKKWKISNDQIEKCKDCQYRYCCISNSDLISNGDTYKKLEQCSFDIEKNVWNYNPSK